MDFVNEDNCYFGDDFSSSRDIEMRDNSMRGGGGLYDFEKRSNPRSLFGGDSNFSQNSTNARGEIISDRFIPC